MRAVMNGRDVEIPPEAFMKIEDVLHGLKANEQRALTERFGLEDGIWRSMDEAGDRLGHTKQWVSQLCARGIRRVQWQVSKGKLKGLVKGV